MLLKQAEISSAWY